MRLIAFIEYVTIFFGIVAMLAAPYFVLDKGFQFGLFLVGAGIALGGLEGVLTRRIGFRPYEDAYEAYAGAPALILGLMALVIGSGVIAASYLQAEGQWHAALGYIARRPAPLLAVSGLLLIGTGVLLMLNPLGRRALAWTLLVRVPRTLLGFVLLAGGLAGIGLGVWEWQAPAAFDELLTQVRPRLRWPW